MKWTSPTLGVFFLIFLIACNSGPSSKAEADDGSRPRLVVLISVDQMRMDYFYHFGGFFQHGLKRLWDEGAVFTEAYHLHAYSETAPGHASISTGSHPSRHGITGNNFYVPTTRQMEYCVEDRQVQALGIEEGGNLTGSSPHRLMRSTLGDWLKETSPESKVFAVALKDRASILMAGKKADQAFWFDNMSTRFISSAYYSRSYPNWARRLTGKEVMAREIEAGWLKKLPEEAYPASREDDFEQESGIFTPDFPHTMARMRPSINQSFRQSLMLWNTPFGDAFTLEFARTLVEREGLGEDGVTDLLIVGCSTADAIGHHFGPFSHEVQDYYVHIDEYLGGFFDYLDEKIGAGRYWLAFTSDHGILPMPEELQRRGFDARRVLTEDFQDAMRQAERMVMKEFDFRENIILLADISGVSLDYREATAKGISKKELRDKVAAALKRIDFVEETFTFDELQATEGNKPYFDYFRNSYYPGRGHEIKLLFKKHTLPSYRQTGTSHGSPYEYDTHVPIIFMGPPFQAGRYDRKVATVDLAPTLAKALGIRPEEGIDGVPLEEAFK
jgi:predicted AlkP superfamily pyrophosphatase or phosphodiesterase